jgi:hypothetical protein
MPPLPTRTGRNWGHGFCFMLVVFGLNGVLPGLVQAQSALEDPQPGSLQSGIGLIRGWVCNASRVEIEFVGVGIAQAAYGTSRADTREICRDDGNNGFGLLFNWNLLGNGTHTIRALADGAEFARAAVTVTTLGEQFLEDVDGQFPLSNFPQVGRNDLSLQWQESAQNFVLRGAAPAASGGGNVDSRVAVLEDPQPGSFQSGIGLIRGWVCNASRVEIEFDGNLTLQAAYGTSRADTSGICGDEGNNGFGLLFNWNLLGDGAHTVRALADGVVFAQATFTVTTLGLGEQFPRGVSGAAQLTGFPVAGAKTLVQWQESLQNFLIIDLIEPGSVDNVERSKSAEGVSDGEGGESGWTAERLRAAQAIFLKMNNLQRGAALSVLELHERAQTGTGGFVACDDRLEFVQVGMRFTAAAFAWRDALGNRVCTTIAPGATLNTTITVREPAELDFNAPFQVFYAGQLVFEFAERQPGQPQLTTTPIPLELNFGRVAVGAMADRSFTVLNSGEGTLTGMATTVAPFSLVGGGSFALAAGQSQPITVRFRPVEEGAFEGTVTVVSNEGSASVRLVGIGESDGSCSYSIAPASQAFGATGGVGSVSVSTTPESGCEWNAVSNVPWITITSGTNGSGAGVVNYTVAANSGASQRSGTLTIAGQTVTVTQEAAPLIFHTLTVAKTGTGSGTVTSNPAGINCGADCMEDYIDGTVVTLLATPAADSAFAEWQGDADCSDGQVTMTAARTCTAVFTLPCVNPGGTDGCYPSLQAAVDALQALNNIRIAAGIYDETVVIAKSLTLQGEGAGSTIVDGGGSGAVFEIANGAAVTLQAMTITNGGFSGIANHGTLTLIDSTVTNNNCDGSGGGIYNDGAMTITNSSITDNSATNDGGGIFNAGNLTLNGSTIRDNTASAGGGLSNSGTAAAMNTSITNNAPTDCDGDPVIDQGGNTDSDGSCFGD